MFPSEEKKEPVILEINLNNYPGLVANPDATRELLKDHLIILSDALEKGYHKASQEAFKQSYPKLLQDVSDALFDYKSLLKHHPNKAEAESMEILELENNPLSIFSGYSTPFDFKGNKLEAKDFIGPYSTFKNWFQAQLYASRYLPYQDYVKFMYLNEYDVLEAMKHQNVEKLLTIKPALAFQKENNLPIGKFINGTGFFDCGPLETVGKCQACQSEKVKTITPTEQYCLECKSGFKN